VFVGSCFAVVGVVLGLITSVALLSGRVAGPSLRGIVLAPVMYGVGGFVFGMALMCLVAPRAFLTGPVGQPWMKLIGTNSVPVARIACLLFGLIVAAPVVAIGLFFALSE
jgi:hypothetical protein